ncbi:MAG: hypothetical protein JXB49_37015 [Bacteroidales bacterium]|nr:hypothetical protein [Bacteroidales bacterium]
MKTHSLILIFFVLLFGCQNKVEDQRYPILLNMVHHNPGEPKFETQYTEPAFLKEKGYTGQIPKIEIQCALTYDRWQENVVPEKSKERLWINRHAAEIDILINNAEKAGMPLYPFTDVLVIPQSIMDKYGDEMKLYGKLSIQKERTQEILRAQIDEIFWRFPKIAGLTIRFGETYLHDTPFHKGTRPVYTPEDHTLLINILREEVCVKRNKKLFYRTWDFGYLHTQPVLYLKATDPVEPHPNLYFSVKHANADFLRGYPFNKTIGIGKHQQIVEISTNQAGCYGKNSHPYYIGKGIIENWSEMTDKKGIRDLYDNSQIKGFWIWTWGDSWQGPYFGNELWVNLNEYVLRSYILNPKQTEEEIFYNYALNHLHLSQSDADKLRELCLLSTDAVYYGQASKYFEEDDFWMRDWWVRDHYFTAINLSNIVKRNLQKEIITEKEDNIRKWYQMEKLASEIKMNDPEDQKFLQVSTTYGRIKYELIEQIWRVQIILAENEAGKNIDKDYAQKCIDTYMQKWKEWEQLKKDYPSCPTLYIDNWSEHCGPPFQTSLKNNKFL